jgi:phospholipid/cholesterol/gamma-HCH transport system substrate-binding protein
MSKEFRVGLLGLTAIVMFYYGFNFLKGSDMFSGMNDYHVKYANVDGLVTSNAVMLNGLQVGKVKSINLLPKQKNALDVVLSINKKIQLPQGTEAVLADNGFLGGKLINLVFGNNKKMLEDNGQLIAKTETGISALIKEKTLPMLGNVETLISQLKIVAASFDSTGMLLDRMLVNSNRTVNTLDGTLLENRDKLKQITANITSLTTSLIETEKGIKPLMGKFGTVADSLNALKLSQAVATTQKSLESLQGLIAGLEAGQGTAGKLLKSDSLYHNLNRTMVDLDQLFINLKAEPKRYVHFSLFGKKDKKKTTESK